MSTIPKLALIPSGVKASKLYSVLPTNGTGDFDFSRASSATRVNKDGLIETVGSNIPRLNYPLIDGVVSGCPSLLLEPQRTNFIPYSEDFSNASWGKQAITVTSNAAISPDGLQTADKIIPSAASTTHQITNLSVISSQTCTTSIFAKADGINTFDILDGSNAVNGASFNILNGTITNKGSGVGSMIYYGNGWYKCIVVSTTTGFRIYCPSSAGDATGDGTSGVLFWGAMIEAGSFPTSYIKSNSGGSVTRSAETCNGAGDATTFNDSEGVLMVETKGENDGTFNYISISDGGTQNYAGILYTDEDNQITYRYYVGGSGVQIVINDIIATNFNKIAIKYKANDFAIWVNGIERGTASSGSLNPSGTFNELSFARGGSNNTPFYGNTKQIQYFDTALQDSELETLTSYTSFNAMATNLNYEIL